MATLWITRFMDALEVLAGSRPPDDIVASWLAPGSDCTRLQDWLGENTSTKLMRHTQFIAIIDAAHVIADTPDESEPHDMRGEDQT